MLQTADSLGVDVIKFNDRMNDKYGREITFRNNWFRNFELFKEANLYDKLGPVDIGAIIDRSVARILENEGLRGGLLEVTLGTLT